MTWLVLMIVFPIVLFIIDIRQMSMVFDEIDGCHSCVNFEPSN